MNSIFDYISNKTVDEIEGRDVHRPHNWFGAFLVLAVISAIILVIVTRFIGYFNYLDFSEPCYIKIYSSSLSGNRQTLVEALEKLKVRDPVNYRNVCRYVSVISESPCITSQKYGSQVQNLDVDGCYIKGSKIIFVRPDSRSDPSVVENRIDTIVKYTQESMKFWNSTTLQ